MRHWPLVCVLALGCASNTGNTSPSPARPPSSSPTEEADEADDAPASERVADVHSTAPTIFAAAGDAGVVNLAIWPERWPQIQTALAGLEPSDARPMRTLARLGELDSAWSALAAFGAAVGLPLPESRPASVDPSQPIVASGFAPLRAYEDTLRSLTDSPGDVALAGFRHRVVIPSEAPTELREMIAAAIEAGGLRRVAADGSFHGSRVALRFEIGPSWLVLDVASGVGLDALDFDALGVPRADFSSAGALFVAERPSAARLHVQLDALGPAGGADGSLALSGSVAEQPKYEAPLSTLLTFGTSFALYSDALIEPETALVHDLLLEVAGDPARVHLGLVLTEAGHAVASADPKLRRGRSVELEALDWAAMLDVVDRLPRHSALAGLTKADELEEMLLDCGIACRLDVGAGNGLIWVAAQRRWGDREMLRELEASARELGLPLTLTLDGGLLLGVLDSARSPLADAGLRPIAVPAVDAAAACHRSYLLAIAKALHQNVTLAPERMAEALIDVRDAVAPALACAEDEPTIAARARAIAAVLDRLVDLASQTPGPT